MATVFTRLTCNFSKSSKVRRERLDGRDYLVAPAVLLTEGVHAGGNSEDGVLYQGDLLADLPMRWDHKPIVTFHPKENDEFVTACSHAVLDENRIGMILATNYADGLRTETWFDELRTQEVEPRIIEKLTAGEMIELSTGVYMKVREEAGEYKGKKYTRVATNLAPDHIAVLVDDKGACSCTDGCGVLQCNNAKITVNETSYDNIRSSLSRLVEASYGYNFYVRDVYNGFFVYRDGNADLFKKSYSVDAGGKITLGEDATPVKWVTEYRTEAGKFVGNSKHKETPSVDTTKQIDYLVANTADTGWEESDRAALAGFTAAKVKGLYDVAVKAKANPAPVPVPAPAPAPVVAATPAPAQIPTVEAYIANLRATAPAEIADTLGDLLNSGIEQRKQLVAKIVANKANQFTPDYLGKQNTEFLTKVAGMLGVDAAPAAPASPFYVGQPGIIANAAINVPEEATYDWASK